MPTNRKTNIKVQHPRSLTIVVQTNFHRRIPVFKSAQICKKKMDATLVKLLKITMRMFYSGKETIAVDLLANNGWLRLMPEEQLAFLLRIKVDELRRCVSRLRLESILKVYVSHAKLFIDQAV